MVVIDREESKASDQGAVNVLTLKNRLVRLLSEPAMQTKQGALEYNAFLLKNLVAEMGKSDSELTATQKKTALTILYLNLAKLAKSADKFMDSTIERAKLERQLEALGGQNPDYTELAK